MRGPLRILLAALAAAAGTSGCWVLAGLDERHPEGDTGEAGTDALVSIPDGPRAEGAVDGGGRAARIAFEVNDSTVKAAEGRVVLPPWLVFVSPSRDKTTQVSATAIKLGFGADVPRMRDVGFGRGLSVEPSRTNECFPSELPLVGFASDPPTSVWVLDSGGVQVSAMNLASPADTSTASQMSLGDEEYGARAAGVALGTNAQTWSLWAKRLGGATTYKVRTVEGAVNSGWTFAGFGSAWARDSYTRILPAIGGDFHLAFEARDTYLPAGGQAAVTLAIYGMQYESGSYPSSLIPTAGAPRTRAAESLRATNAEELVPNGFLDLEIVFAPHFASNENVGDLNVIAIDLANGLFLGRDRKMALRVANVALETGPLAWKRNDVFVVVAKNTAAGQTLEVRIGDAAPVTKTAPAAGPMPVTKTLSLLSNPKKDAEDGADLRALRVY